MLQYIVMYGKIVDDKECGAMLVGVYFGGVCDTEAEADEVASKCVAESQGGMIIPKVAQMRTTNICEVVREIEKQFQNMAEQIYENERAMNSFSARRARSAKGKLP